VKTLNIFTGLVLPLDRINVDTDAIIPKQFLKSVQRTGYGANLFYQWRYLNSTNDQLIPNQDFLLNQSRYTGATILLTRANFGCGSSREHAVWALTDYGFRIIIAPSFAEIFYHNCLKNGVLPLNLDNAVVDDLFKEEEEQFNYRLTINLEEQTITTQKNRKIIFEIDPFQKHRLLNGLDDISLTMQYQKKIRAFEDRRRTETPWLFENFHQRKES